MDNLIAKYPTLPFSVFAVLAATACADDHVSSTGTGGCPAAAPLAIQCPEAPGVAGCGVALLPSQDDYTSIESALADARPGEKVCLCPGSFHVSNELDVDTNDVTLTGLGTSREDTVLDFSSTSTSSEPKAMAVTGNGFTLSNLWIKNTPGNGVVATGVKGVTFRDLKASWDAGSSSENGTYAIYPVSSEDVLVERVEVVGAADAGIYVGKSTRARVASCTVHGSVAGIESENTTDMDIVGNDVYDNTSGILVFVLPGLEKKDSLRTRVTWNHVHENNRANFGTKGVVAGLPSGIGVLLVGADEAEIDHDTIEHQDSGGVVIVSGDIFMFLDSNLYDAYGADAATDRYPERNFVHENAFTDIGANPDSILAGLPVMPIEQVLWDGQEASSGSAELCLGTDDFPTFRDVHGLMNVADASMQTTDTAPFACKHASRPPVTF